MNESELKILCKVLGIETIRQLETEIKNTRNAVKDATIGSKEWADSEAKLSQQLTLKSALMKGARSDQSQLMQSYFALGQSIRAVEQALMAVGAAYAATKVLVEFAETAARVEMLRNELQALGKKENFNATELINQMSDAAGGSVTQIDLMQIALRAVRLGNIDLEKMPAIMQKIEHESKLAGVSTREMFDQFIRGAETGSAKFQVQFGLLYDVKKAEEDYAASVGTTVKNLSDEETRMLKVNAAFAALLNRQEVATTEGEKTIERFEQLNAVWERVKIKLGEIIGLPLSKFLLSVGLEAVIVADSVITLYNSVAALVEIAIGASKYAFGDKAGAMENASAAEGHLNNIKKAGDDIRAQFKAIGDMWLNIEKKTSGGGKIGGTPTSPVHVAGATELAEKIKEENKLFDDQLKLLRLKHESGMLSNEDYAEELESLQLLTKTDEQYYDIQKLKVELSKKAAAEIIKNERDEEEAERKRLKKIKDDYEAMGIMNRAFIGGTLESFDNMAWQFSNAWEGMWARNIGNTQTLLAQFIQSVVSQFAALALKLGALQVLDWIFPTTGIFSLFGFANGGVIPEPVVGRGLQTGSYYSFAEKGMEVYDRGRIIPNNQLSSRGGKDAGMAQMAKAINNLNANVARLSASNGTQILTMTKLAKQSYDGRTM